MNKIGINTLEQHAQITHVISLGPEGVDSKWLIATISNSADSKLFFYANVTSNWFAWLRDNNLLSVNSLRVVKFENGTEQIPEMRFLERIAREDESSFVEYVVSQHLDKQKVDVNVPLRFRLLAKDFSEKNLSKFIDKMLGEDWAHWLAPYRTWGFEYEEMFKTLRNAGDDVSVNKLAQIVLTVRDREKNEVNDHTYSRRWFYVDDLKRTEVIDALLSTKEPEQSLAVVHRSLDRVVRLAVAMYPSESKSGLDDGLFFSDVDFFKLTVSDIKSYSQEDIRSLFAVYKLLYKKVVENASAHDVVRIYESFPSALTESETTWRLKLSLMSLTPDALKDVIVGAIQRILHVKNKEELHDLMYGAEYATLLKRHFNLLSHEQQNEYIDGLFTLFPADEKDDEKRFSLIRASRVASCVYSYLNEEQKAKMLALGWELDPNYIPTPMSSGVTGGTVIHQTPESIKGRPIDEVLQLLKTRLKPENIKDTSQNFLRPISASGVAADIEGDFAERPYEYLTNAASFFDRQNIDPGYTYKYIWGVIGYLKKDGKLNLDQQNGIVTFIQKIVESGKSTPFSKVARNKNSEDFFLSNWDGVQVALTGLLHHLLEYNDEPVSFEKNRQFFIETLAYLLASNDPTPEEEVPKLRTKNDGGEEYSESDPFTKAINSVRGRAFQALAMFVDKDVQLQEKQGKKTDEIRLSDDVKSIYLELVQNEKTRAVRFLFGKYLATFYLRDPKWIQEHFGVIFNRNSNDLYLAAMEGYLTSGLWYDVFTAMQPEYSYLMELNKDRYTKRKYFRDLDEGLATHFGLAFMHYDNFSLENSEILKRFINSQNEERLSEFIKFIGGQAFSRSGAKKWIEEQTKNNHFFLERLLSFWTWANEHIESRVILSSFGLWVDAEEGVIVLPDLARRLRVTMEKSAGLLSWDHGMTKSLPLLASAAPEDTLAIVRLHFLGSDNKLRIDELRWVYIDETWKEAFTALYSREDLRPAVRELVNDLVFAGSEPFWPLVDIVKES